MPQSVTRARGLERQPDQPHRPTHRSVNEAGQTKTVVLGHAADRRQPSPDDRRHGHRGRDALTHATRRLLTSTTSTARPPTALTSREDTGAPSTAADRRPRPPWPSRSPRSTTPAVMRRAPRVHEDRATTVGRTAPVRSRASTATRWDLADRRQPSPAPTARPSRRASCSSRRRDTLLPTAHDRSTYRANDGTVNGNTATVAVTVTCVNDAPVAGRRHGPPRDAERTRPSIRGATASAMDTDVEGDSLTVSFVNGWPPTSDLVTVASAVSPTDGSFTYEPERLVRTSTPARPHRQRRHRQRRRRRRATRTVTITITGVNDAPVAVDDTGTTNEDSDLIVAAPGVLGNDTDVEGDSLTVAPGQRPGRQRRHPGHARPRARSSPSTPTARSPTTRTARSRTSTPARPTPTPSPTGANDGDRRHRTPPRSRSRSPASTTRRSRSTTRARPTRTATSSSPPRACSAMTPTSRATA